MFMHTAVKCPKCKGTDFYIRDFDERSREGDVYCRKCNVYVRMLNAS